jgi:hypothetical protein
MRSTLDTTGFVAVCKTMTTIITTTTTLWAILATTMLLASCNRADEQKPAIEAKAQSATEITKPSQYKAFGDSLQSKSAPIALADAINAASTDEKAATPVRIEAKVVDVCQKKGCWMMLTDGKSTMRVTFKDYGFFMPKDITGKTIIAEGIVKADVLTEADARHYAEDAGKSKAEIAAIKGDQKQVSMIAQSVFMLVN